MPGRKQYRGRKQRKGGKRYGKRRYMKKTKGSSVREWASCVQEREFTTMPNISGSGPAQVPLTTGQILGVYNISLSSNDRAVQIARAYQYYRITKVEVIVKPQHDTFAAAIGTATIPYFYYLVDKGQSVLSSLTTFNSLRDAGAKPIRMDDKTIKFSFRPAVATGVYDAGSAGGPAPAAQQLYAKPVNSPWLLTNALANTGSTGTPSGGWLPSSIDHRGFAMGAEALIPNNTAGGKTPWAYTMRVHFQFKVPNTAINITSPVNPVFSLVDYETNSPGDI